MNGISIIIFYTKLWPCICILEISVLKNLNMVNKAIIYIDDVYWKGRLLSIDSGFFLEISCESPTKKKRRQKKGQGRVVIILVRNINKVRLLKLD